MSDLELALADLLRPLPVDAFFSTHWEREPALVRGPPDKFAPLGFTTETLVALGQRADHGQPCSVWEGAVDRIQRARSSDPAAILQRYEAGCTVSLANVQAGHP